MKMKIIKKIKQRFCNHNGECAGYRKGNRYICNCEKCGKTLIDFTIIREKNNAVGIKPTALARCREFESLTF